MGGMVGNELGVGVGPLEVDDELAGASVGASEVGAHVNRVGASVGDAGGPGRSSSPTGGGVSRCGVGLTVG